MSKPSLPAAEMDVLTALDRLGEATAAQVREATHGYRPMSHGSMVTLLKRLEAKKLVVRKKGSVGKAFVYSATRRRTTTFRGVLSNLVQRMFHGDSPALVASLFQTKPPTRDDLEAIQRLVNEARKKMGEEPDGGDEPRD
jgi:BlaI family penicillinase repressor